jgi:uncharacterized membrane protein
MALADDVAAAIDREVHVSHGDQRSRTWRWLARPVTIFILLSVPFGLATIAINPPLRGNDETAHFLRVYGITSGDVVPSVQDDRNRRGVFIPAQLHADLSFFEAARQQVWTPGFDYRTVFINYQHNHGSQSSKDADGQPAFALYQGSEAYSPAPYLPSIVASLVGRAFGADFLTLFYLMRIAGLLAMTAATAYAIAVVPHLQWTFLTIAMLPSAFYGRTVIGADGATVSFTLVVAALCLRQACCPDDKAIWQRAVFMGLCVLSKPPQVAWLILEAMCRPLREIPRQWRTIALVTLPGLILTGLWVAAATGDVGAWRVASGLGMPAELFEPTRKISRLFADPLHFPALLLASLGIWELNQLWRQLIGVLGWLDTGLRDWLYPVLSALLMASVIVPLPLDRVVRYRVAAASIVAAVAYILAVYLIFYLTWTPINATEIWGVQGRYFVVLLAPLAVAIAALVNRGLRERTRSALAIGSAVLSIAATIDAILRVNW